MFLQKVSGGTPLRKKGLSQGPPKISHVRRALLAAENSRIKNVHQLWFSKPPNTR